MADPFTHNLPPEHAEQLALLAVRGEINQREARHLRALRKANQIPQKEKSLTDILIEEGNILYPLDYAKHQLGLIDSQELANTRQQVIAHLGGDNGFSAKVYMASVESQIDSYLTKAFGGSAMQL